MMKSVAILEVNECSCEERGGADIGVARIFNWRWGPKPQITCYDVIRNFERGIFCGDEDIVDRRSEAAA